MRRVILPSRVAWGLASVCFACTPAEPKVASAIAGLPEYTATEGALFSDALSAAVFGLPSEVPAGQDPKLRERTTVADSVFPVHVSTVTAESLAGVRGYVIAVVADGPALSGEAPSGQIEIRFGPGNPSLSQVQTSDATLVGKHFLLFARRYADGGEAVLHFYGEGDTPAVRNAITSAKLLDAVKAEPSSKHP